MKYLIVGLGNIGPKYDNTRHNIGFDVVDELAKKHDTSFKTDKLGDVAEFKFKGRSFYLLKPNTFMNLSGKAVRYWKEKLKLNNENIMVVVDDLALPLGSIRIRKKGSDAGHNGLKNINELLGGNKYPRLRFGIGNDFSKGKQINFVLGEWKSEEESTVNEMIEKSCQAIEAYASIGIDRTMNQFNS
jgi:PTH1 family peptidyl-tRNA hydrolase